MTDKLAIEALINGVKAEYLSGDISTEEYSELLSFMSTAEWIKFDESDNDFKVSFSTELDELTFFVKGQEFNWKWS